MKSLVICPVCSTGVYIKNGAISRAEKIAAPLYCGRACAGIARRKLKLSDITRRCLKAEYDREYRERNRAKLKAQKAAGYQRRRDPAKEREQRRLTQVFHNEYCRRPEYRAYKQQYDRRYRAKQDFGEYWECAMLIGDLDAEIGARITRNEVYAQNGTQNKSLKRKRDYAKAIGR